MKTFSFMTCKKKSWATFLVLCFFVLILTSACVYKKMSYVNVDGKEGLLKDIDPVEAFALITRNRLNPNFILLDVRTSEEYEKEHLEGAILLDYHQSNFQDEIKKLDRNKTYVIYCRVGNRSGNTFELMRDFRFKEVYNIFGGIKKWKADELPVIRK
jgi:rhodanese-related sulfurtransferase